jgi:hypothetical protein
VASPDPATIMAEYARLTDHAELPPLWSFGYQQSHRTLARREEILAEAITFREKKLPCDALIFRHGVLSVGLEYRNGSFSWNSRVFPEPKEIVDELHKENFRVVLHDVILNDTLRGTVHDSCELSRFDLKQAICSWDAHRKDFALGVDGWWPDEGDPLDIASRLVRNRMHWEGPQLDRPNERPYALHRNRYAGMQRYGCFLVRGCVLHLGDAENASADRDQYFAVRHSVLGHGYWRLRTYKRVYGRTLPALVSVRRILYVVPLPWPHLEAATTLGLEHRRSRSC